MASPWISPQRPSADRPWMGIAMLAAIPLLSLILIRMLWSGSSLWFLTVGIILLGAAAVVFLAHRPQEQAYGHQTLAPDSNRAPLVLMALGVLFLAMLLLPNFAGHGGSQPDAATQQRTTSGLRSDVSGVQQTPVQLSQAQPTLQQSRVQQPAVQQPSAQPQGPVIPEGSQTYTVQDGDNLWDIAQRFGTTVEAIVAVNSLENAAAIQVDQELIIPPAEQGAAPAEQATPAAESQ